MSSSFYNKIGCDPKNKTIGNWKCKSAKYSCFKVLEGRLH